MLAWTVRLVYALKLVILCLAYQMAMRIIELARGVTYNHALHWAVKHFDRAGALTVTSGNHITLRPTQRKCPIAAAMRPVPILYLAECEINAVRAYRELREMDPATEHSERNHCAFRVDSKGSAPSSTWYRKELKEELFAACPDAPVNIRQTPHILRRGALSAHVHNGIDPVVIDIIAVLAPNSTRAVYTGHMPSAIIDSPPPTLSPSRIARTMCTHTRANPKRSNGNPTDAPTLTPTMTLPRGHCHRRRSPHGSAPRQRESRSPRLPNLSRRYDTRFRPRKPLHGCATPPAQHQRPEKLHQRRRRPHRLPRHPRRRQH